MAFTVTARHTGQNIGQTMTTDTHTPTLSSLLLVFAGGENDLHSTASSWQLPTGGGWTYSQIAASADFAWAGSTDFSTSACSWRADVGLSALGHTITVDKYSGTQSANYNAVSLDITGHNTSTPVAQSKTGGASVTQGDTVSGSVTLDATPATNGLVVAYFAAGNDAVGAFTAPTIGGQTMTQLHNQTGTFCHGGAWYRVITGAESSATVTCSDMGQSVGNWAGIVVEIAEAGAAPPETARRTPVIAPSRAAMHAAVW